MAEHLRTLWLSDIHLGTAASRAGNLLEFLDGVSADRIYLTGDIVDIERLRIKPAFPPRHWQLVNRFVQLARQGTEVIYIPGNHDHEIREFAGSRLCGIRVALEARHRTAAGEMLLVIHGDCLDGRIRKGTNLESFGAAAYTWLVEADARFEKLRGRIGGRERGDHKPIATRIKARLRTAREYIARFERSAAEYARERGADGVVCGHIHRPALCSIGGIRYANDGDWVEHCTAIGENADGDLRLMRWQDGKPVLVDDVVGDLAAA